MISKEHIKFIKSLHKKKFRDQHQLFILEGHKMIEEAIKYAPNQLVEVFGVDEWNKPAGGTFTFQEIDRKTLQQISLLKHPQGQLAICSYLPVSTKRPEFILALDTVQDPGNLGTILRLAAWFGVNHIVASKETVDKYNPKVVQASMGAVFNVEMEYLDLKGFLSQAKMPIYGALLDGENIYEKKVEKKGILLMGNEGNGIAEELIPMINQPIAIPQFGQGESLNVAMATAVLLSEFSRSR